VDARGTAPKTVDGYVARYPPRVRAILAKLRNLVREEAPSAVERISYGIPTFDLHGPLVYFAAFEHHIGFYPTSSGIEAFKKRLGTYKSSSGAVRFPLPGAPPYDLVREMVRYRVEENVRRAGGKRRRGERREARAPRAVRSGRRAPGATGSVERGTPRRSARGRHSRGRASGRAAQRQERPEARLAEE